MSPSTRRTLLVMLLMAAPMAVAPAWAEPPRETKGAVPFTMLLSNHMVVRAKINGKGPFRLIFDLGAPITLLSNQAAVESGTVQADAPRLFVFGMRGEARIETLELGDLTARDVPAFVFDHPVLKALSDAIGGRLDGIVGFTFFARYRTTIDYQAETMTFEPVDFKIRDLIGDLQNRLEGPKVARERMLAPGGLWGLSVGEPAGGLDAKGVPVTSVLPDAPAAAAGLKVGDVLTTLNGRWTASVADRYDEGDSRQRPWSSVGVFSH
jgi:Aspartyl protease/PDZ domain